MPKSKIQSILKFLKHSAVSSRIKRSQAFLCSFPCLRRTRGLAPKGYSPQPTLDDRCCTPVILLNFLPQPAQEAIWTAKLQAQPLPFRSFRRISV